MTEYGTDSEPGVITLVESELSATLSGGSPANIALIGRHDPENGSTNPGDVEVIQRASQARDYFGSNSPLTRNVLDALNEGAYPVRAVASDQSVYWDTTEESVSVTEGDTDIFTGTLTETPSHDWVDLADNDGDALTEYTVKWVDSLPADADVESGKFYILNGSTDFKVEIVLGDTDLWAEYRHEVSATELEEFQGSIDSLTTGDSATNIDGVGILSVDEDTQTELEVQLDNMADDYQFAVGFFPAAENITDTATYTPAFDNSRIQVIYPGFDSDGNYAVGSYVGMRGRLGIRTTPIRKRLQTQGKLNDSLTEQERADLISNNVVPIQSDPEGARVIDDVNTVSEDNLTEANIQFAYTRLVADYLLKVIQVEQDGYIGKLNRPAMRSSLKASIDSRIRELKNSSQVIDFDSYIESKDATTATMEINLDLADPLRYVENTITIED